MSDGPTGISRGPAGTRTIAGIAAPIVTGFIVAGTHSYNAAFLAAAAFLLIGIACYVFLLGNMAPVPEPNEAIE